MKIMKKFGMNLLVLMLVSTATFLIAQTPESKTLKFALTIEEEQLSAQAGYLPTDHEVLVKYTNTSDTVQRDDCAVARWEYKVTVLRDGTLVENRYAHKKKTEESVPPGAIKLELDEGVACHSDGRGLNPGQSAKFPIWVSSEYDMTVPGTYEITVTRDTDHWNPDKNVTVKSNTLTIVVPEPGAAAPQ
jgi:hypothetical protein